MNSRSYKSIVTFSSPFTLTAHPKELPAGEYELLVEEDVHPGLQHASNRGQRAYLTARNSGDRADPTETLTLSEEDLKMALGHVWDILDDHNDQNDNQTSDAALYPPEEMKWTLPNG